MREGTGGTDEICSDVFTVTVAPVVPLDLHVGVWAESKLDKVWTKTTTVAPGKEFKLYATVRNTGDKSDKTALWFYLQDEDTKSAKELGGSQIDPLPMADGTTEVTKHITVTAPETPGHYIYSASVDDVDGEKKSSNNYAEVTITVQEIRPDLVIESITVSRADDTTKTGYINVNPGDKFKLNITVKNEGSPTRAETFVKYYRSQNATLSETDTPITTGGSVSLTGKSSFSRILQVTAPQNPGIYYYGACVDSIPGESNTDNNCSEVVRVTVSGISLTLPDNLITEVAFGPNSTYFIFNPQVPTITGIDTNLTIHDECVITVDIPGVRDEPVGWLDQLPKYLDYLMFPIDNLNWEESGGIEAGEALGHVGDLAETVVEGVDRFETAKKVLPKLVQGLAIASEVLAIISDVNEYRKATADPKMEIKEGENYYSFLFMIPERLSHVNIKMERYYQHKSEEGGLNVLPWLDPTTHIVKYEGRWNLEEAFQQETPGLAAPRARPMSLADYPPFQWLSPEVQEYLLQHLGKFDSTMAVNLEAWQIPQETSLLSNYPNPFNPETWIPYQLSEPADVKLTIYDINGRVVRNIDLGHQRAGTYHGRSRAAYWDGRNAAGEPIASGLYFYTLTAGDFIATRKMLIRK